MKTFDMKTFKRLLAAEAELMFAVPLQGGQNDPRLDGLFAQLRNAKSREAAERIEQSIQDVWMISGNGAADLEMLQGLQALSRKDGEEAIAAFTRAIEAQPDFAEAWNKRGTVNFLLERYDASVRDIRKTVEMEPRHFGALSGLGLIHLGRGNYREALAAFDSALAANPWLPGAESTIRSLRERLGGG